MVFVKGFNSIWSCVWLFLEFWTELDSFSDTCLEFGGNIKDCEYIIYL